MEVGGQLYGFDSLLPPLLGFQISGVCNPQGAVPYSLNCLPSSADSHVRKPVCTLQVITAVQCGHSLRDMSFTSPFIEEETEVLRGLVACRRMNTS